ncbi:hypothetical protein SH668x_001036 [Planctomicrobium sp. SH668]|uniref:hypothetical protein n=1 Tax=Planctomicrobium sp. SH668 TaxID=3448126 RepID=UPI003F5BE7D0
MVTSIKARNSSPSAKKVPDSFPAEDQYTYQDAVPDFLLFASLGLRRTIQKARWEALTKSQQRYVHESLASREIVLVEKRNELLTMHREVLEARPVIGAAEPVSYCFGSNLDDVRFGTHCDITFAVVNANSREHAREKLKEFLDDLKSMDVDVI